jgi:transcriptional antiterminator NusG
LEVEKEKIKMSKEEETNHKPTTSVFAVRTTAGQEKNVADFIAARIRTTNLPIKAILVPETLKGYVLIEAEGPHFVEKAIAGIKHVRSRIQGVVSFQEVEQYIIMKPIIDELNQEDLVEIIGGPFKGMKAKITRIDKTKEEVTLELLEATFTLPITVHADYVRLVEKAKKEEAS